MEAEHAAVEIVDGHAHVGSMRFVPDSFVHGIAENISSTAPATNHDNTVAQVAGFLEAQHQDHLADELIAQMNAAGISKTTLLIPDFTMTLPCSLSIEDMALCHHQIRQRHPNRFFILQGVDPRAGAKALSFFEKTILEYGFDGLKLYPPCGYSPSDQRLFPFYELCSDLGLPVLLHTGPTSPVLSFRFSSPYLIDEAARSFPRVNFILAHGGVNNVNESVALCAYRPNVYLDTSGFLTVLHPHGWEAHLRELFSLKINHKIVFGTDWPFGRLAGGQKRTIDQLFSKDGPLDALPLGDVRNIMGLNMRRLVEAQRKRSNDHAQSRIDVAQ